MRARSVLVFSVVALLFVASVAQADEVFGTYSWLFNGAPTKNYIATPGSTVTVSVALLEVGGNTLSGFYEAVAPHSGNIGGLSGMGATMNWSGGPAYVNAVSDITINSSFTSWAAPDPGILNEYGPGTASITDYYAVYNGSGVLGTAGGGGYEIQLGTFTFQAGATAGVTQLDLGAFGDAGGGGTAVNDDGGTGIDASIPDGYCTITTTPEPSTLVLSGIAGLAFLGLRLRCRKTA